MNTMIFGIGECGRNITLQLYTQLKSLQYKFLLKNFYFFSTDIEDILRLINDIKSKGISPGELNVFMLTPTSSYAGVGGDWIVACEIAKKFFEGEGENRKYIDIIDLSIRVSDCFNIFNSAGGGTGNGAGPVFLEYMRNKSAEESSRKLYTTTIVLPFKKESGSWRDVNAAVNIARYSKLCDGILIADNEHLKNSIKQDAKAVQKKVNELLSNVWIWMNACSSAQLRISPKRWEGADFKRSFELGTRGALVVPCYREEKVEKLKMVSLKWIVLRTIKENCAAECLPETSNKILVIASLPDREGCPSSESDVANYISQELFKGKKSTIDVIFIRGKVIQNISVIALLVSPKIPRLEEMERNFRACLEDPWSFGDVIGSHSKKPREDILNAYQIEYENFKEYLKDLKMFD